LADSKQGGAAKDATREFGAAAAEIDDDSSKGVAGSSIAFRRIGAIALPKLEHNLRLLAIEATGELKEAVLAVLAATKVNDERSGFEALQLLYSKLNEGIGGNTEAMGLVPISISNASKFTNVAPTGGLLGARKPTGNHVRIEFKLAHPLPDYDALFARASAAQDSILLGHPVSDKASDKLVPNRLDTSGARSFDVATHAIDTLMQRNVVQRRLLETVVAVITDLIESCPEKADALRVLGSSLAEFKRDGSMQLDVSHPTNFPLSSMDILLACFSPDVHSGNNALFKLLETFRRPFKADCQNKLGTILQLLVLDENQTPMAAFADWKDIAAAAPPPSQDIAWSAWGYEIIAGKFKCLSDDILACSLLVKLEERFSRQQHAGVRPYYTDALIDRAKKGTATGGGASTDV